MEFYVYVRKCLKEKYGKDMFLEMGYILVYLFGIVDIFLCVLEFYVFMFINF